MQTKLLPMLLAALCAAFALAAPGRALAHGGGHHSYYPPPPPAGRVTVMNQSGGSVTVSLTGQPDRYLPAWQAASYPSVPTEANLRATYVQFGVERVLQTERLYVTPGLSTTVVLAPERTARVLVTNRSPFDAQLLVDGRPNSTLGRGAARVIALPAGSPELTLVAGNQLLGRTRLTLRPFEEPQWTVDAPRMGDLVVKNPLPIPVQLVCDQNMVRTVQPYGQTVYSGLPFGGFHLTARRLTGEFIDTATTEIRPGQVTWTIDAPTTGFVDFDSDHFLSADVRVDGVRMVTLAPNGAHRSNVKVGWHEVTVTDERGRLVAQTWIEVKPFEIGRVTFGTPAHVPARDERYGSRYDDDDDDDDHEHHGHHDRGSAVAEAGESCGMH